MAPNLCMATVTLLFLSPLQVRLPVWPLLRHASVLVLILLVPVRPAPGVRPPRRQPQQGRTRGLPFQLAKRCTDRSEIVLYLRRYLGIAKEEFQNRPQAT